MEKLDRLEARAVVEGADFCFGHQRAGDRALLSRLCAQHQIELAICSPVEHDGEVVSSSRVRELIRVGDVASANELLVAPYRIRGEVMKGAGRGATIGFPTANLEHVDTLVPPPGVYAARAFGQGFQSLAAVHIGPNPTFGERRLKVEAHLLDFDAELYGTVLEVEFLAKLRGVVAFETVEALCEQLKRDVASVRDISRGNRSIESNPNRES